MATVSDDGDSSAAFSVAMAELNAAFGVLSEPKSRARYDAARSVLGRDSLFAGYDGRPLSQSARPGAATALFIDENACIGCKACAHEAPRSIGIELERGRARVHTQWGDPDDALSAAVDVCPSSCMHWVDARELPLLEWVHRSQPRSSVVFLRECSATGGARGVEEDPFVAAKALQKRAKEAAAEAAARREAFGGGAAAAAAAAAAEGAMRRNGVTSRGRHRRWWQGGGRRLALEEVDAMMFGQSCPLTGDGGGTAGRLRLLPAAPGSAK